MRWPRTGESGSTYVKNASLRTMKTPKVVYWHPLTLDFHFPARVDAFFTAKAILHDTVVSVMAHNTRVIDRVSPPLTVDVEEALDDVETSLDIRDTANQGNPKTPDL